MSKRNIIISIIALLFISLVSLLVFMFLQSNKNPSVETISQTQTNGTSDGNSSDPSTTPTPTTRTSTELIDSITQQSPSLLDANQQPIFGIVNSIRTPSGWYVITIIDKNDPTVGQAKVIMKDNGSAGIVLVAGPGTRFDRDSFTFPEEVWKLL
jgi:cytoskeletal protein RodZ